MARVRVPLRIITSQHYGDPAVAVYVKIAALSQGRDCDAGVAYLSGLLGISRSGVERALTQLGRPAPDDDMVELFTRRQTLTGGRGTTAARWVRRSDWRRERGAWVPSRAPEALNPRQLRLYAALSYATAIGHAPTLAELGDILRHRTGKQAGAPLTSGAVRRILRGLEDLGWITVHERAGERGRHLYEVHEAPTSPPLEPCVDDGSGGDLGDGSLASKEDPQIDSPDDARAGCSIRRRRDQAVERGPVENPGGGSLPPAYRRPYSGPELRLAPRIWGVIEPVRHLLPGLSPYVVRKLAREVGRQLDQGQAPERLRDRLERRYAFTSDIRDTGRWLLGAAVVRRGCGNVDCESGTIWRSQLDCQVCQDIRIDAAAGPGPSRPDGGRPPGPPGPNGPPRVWHECTACQAPAPHPMPDGLCRSCRPAPALTRRP
ncbi:hypothetical protein ACFWPV_10170 [Streptomyces uncialis]|uniref:hypothetical protein n=1 Tax=Streptomyces uncialis TaxID=1048205 RepID=UPI003648C20A